MNIDVARSLESKGPMGDEESIHKEYRKAAYYRFIIMIFDRLGKKNRRVIPSCCVLKIRRIFPSPTIEYMGFKNEFMQVYKEVSPEMSAAKKRKENEERF